MSPLIVGGRTIYGSLSSQPTGITTAVGSEYYDTTLDSKRVYKSTGWASVGGSAAASTDDYYDSVVLHLTGNSPTEEVSRYGHTVTATNAQTVTGKFGNGIGLQDASGTCRRLQIPNNHLNFGTGDFTMEGWIYIGSSNANLNLNYRIFQMGANSTGGYAFLYNNSNVYFGRNDEALLSDPRSNWNDAWHHFAITRTSGTLRLFRDGDLVSSTTNSAGWNNNISDDLFFGVYPDGINDNRSNIILDEVRFTKGVARYTSSFTAPTEAFPQCKVTDVGTIGNPATNADAIYALDNNASAGAYFINGGASGTIRTYCEFNSFGGWMLIAQGDGNDSTPIPTGTQQGTTIFCGGRKGRLSDTVINNLTWTYAWVGMTDNEGDGPGWTDGRNTMDPGRQLFTTSGTKFSVGFNTQNSTYSSGSTNNGRNQTWSYKGIGGSSGSSLTGSPRQPSGNVINGAGNTDYAIGNTNTYGITPHDAGIGGCWVFAGNGSHGNGNFNNGFGSDYNNLSWTSRYSYWFVK